MEEVTPPRKRGPKKANAVRTTAGVRRGPAPSAAPAHLTMRLDGPGMSALRRAGLGGLASTLIAMERQHATGLLREDRLPAPFAGSQPPWAITADAVTLRFGEPEKAGGFL